MLGIARTGKGGHGGQEGGMKEGGVMKKKKGHRNSSASMVMD
jgi:hypothetical protein